MRNIYNSRVFIIPHIRYISSMHHFSNKVASRVASKMSVLIAININSQLLPSIVCLCHIVLQINKSGHSGKTMMHSLIIDGHLLDRGLLNEV